MSKYTHTISADFIRHLLDQMEEKEEIINKLSRELRSTRTPDAVEFTNPTEAEKRAAREGIA